MNNQEPTRKMAFIDYVPHIIFLLFFALITFLLFWNEVYYIHKKRSIREAERVVVKVDDVSVVDPALDGKLIHASALADTKEVLTDGVYGISEKVICLNREVEYYQYEERSSTDDDGDTHYSYHKEWVSHPISSRNFESSYYTNFVLVRIEPKAVYAQDVRFGGYRLPKFILESIDGNVPAEVKLSGDELLQWEKVIAGNVQTLGLPETGGVPMVHVNGNVVYYGRSPSDPSVGDVRVTLTKIPPLQLSILAKVNGDTFEKYTTESGKTFSPVRRGTVTAEYMFTDAHLDNMLQLWGFRLIGIVLAIFAWRPMFSVLPDLLKSDFLESLRKAGFKAFRRVMGFVWTFFVIAIAWVRYSPPVTLVMLAFVAIGLWYLQRKGKKAEIYGL